jgi:hypothetical protein|tara:strand:+ start:1232 stop:1435 length:204 start_codon:yes stop_codon:yes gene_type:complete
MTNGYKSWDDLALDNSLSEPQLVTATIIILYPLIVHNYFNKKEKFATAEVSKHTIGRSISSARISLV